VAINPVDAVRQKVGMYIPSYPHVFGCDAAGTVVSCGSDVKDFAAGDRVTMVADEFANQLSSHGPFQRFVVLARGSLCKIPDALKFEDACVLPLTLATAAGMLFEKESLDLEWPTTDVTTRSNRNHGEEIVVVWGASASVGCCAVQMLRAAGYRVLATASKHNFELVKECGAEAVFDHTEEDCVDQVCKWVEDKKLRLAGVLAIVINPDIFEKCGQVAKRLPGNKHVATSLARGIMSEPDLGEGIKVSSCEYILFDLWYSYLHHYQVWLFHSLIFTSTYGRNGCRTLLRLVS